MNTLAPKSAEIMEAVIARGDLAKLSPDERASYYVRVCESIGLNPMTRPFEYITLNGKLTLYARKDCTDQLRSIYNISLLIVEQRFDPGDLFTVHVKARGKDGREDEDLGVVHMAYPMKIKDRSGNWINHPHAGKPLTGEDRANAVLKTVTKAKRRATLSICGLGFLDETEIEDIPVAEKQIATVTPAVVRDTGPPLHAPPAPAADPAFDGAAWRMNVEEALASCQTGADVFTVSDGIVNMARELATKDEWNAVQMLLTDTLERITSPDEPDNVLAG